MESVKNLYIKLTTEFLVKTSCLDDFEETEADYNVAYGDLVERINIMKEYKQSLELEKIKIPVFYGNVEEWASFHDLFKKFVHENQQLPKVEKLLRLKTLMKGESIKLIQHLPTTENNYECAWDIVKQRFGNKRILFQTLIDKILDQPYANSSSTSSIKNLLDTSNECVQALNALGLEIEAAVLIISRIIIRKLDKEGLLHYEQSTKKSKEIQVLDDVLQFLEQQYRALEAIQPKRFGTFQKHQNKTT